LNLSLRNKKVKEIPVKQWATLVAARKNFPEKGGSIIVAPGLGLELFRKIREPPQKIFYQFYNNINSTNKKEPKAQGNGYRIEE